ncbi:unnamed protein product, partial [Rotaria sordida]
QSNNVEEDKLGIYAAQEFSQWILTDPPSTLRSADLVPSLPPIDETSLPISSSLKSFDLQIVMARCDIRSIGLILRCMPNLHRFVFTLIVDFNISPFIMDLTNGKNWQEILTTYVPYLTKFDFYISFITSGMAIDLNEILNSFRCFLKLYYQWQIGINRWKVSPYHPFLMPFYKNDDDSQQCLDNLSSLIDLSTVDAVEFAPDKILTRLHAVIHVLL